MSSNLEKIVHFINEHHVLSLATAEDSELNVCNLFYAFDANETSFVVACNENTTHIKNMPRSFFQHSR